MPTTKPRLAITLTPESREALERFTKASGIASSQFVSKVVHDAVPMIDAMTRAYLAASKKPLDAVVMMEESLNEAMTTLAQHKLALEHTKRRRKLRRRPVIAK